MDITVIGAAILDVLAGPVSAEVFSNVSSPAENIRLTCGGDAFNEAAALSKLGNSVSLISVLGDDEAGRIVLSRLHQAGVDTSGITIRPELPTGINLVLVDREGERRFITNPKSSLRHLSGDDILPHVRQMADIVSFASLFVSRDLSIPDLTRVFSAIRQVPGRILTADCTSPKNGETLKDLACMLPFLDIIFANETEAALLTGCSTPAESARAFADAGVHCAVVKTGRRGCELFHDGVSLHIPAVPEIRCVDTTGAGDCFAAGFLHALREGMSYEDCARFGCAAASLSIEAVGATEGLRSPELIRERFRKLAGR